MDLVALLFTLRQTHSTVDHPALIQRWLFMAVRTAPRYPRILDHVMAAHEPPVTSQQMLLMVGRPVLILRIKLMPVDIAELLELILVRATDLKGQQHF